MITKLDAARHLTHKAAWLLDNGEDNARHAAEEQGVWMIRNYFNLGTRSFANNSFLVDNL